MTALEVSVITPVYNAAKSITKTVKSVLHQTLQSFEIILINDASTDNSLEIITALAQSHAQISIINLQQNGGPGIARNAGIKRAKGKYIAFLDADDTWHPEKLEKQLDFMEANNYLLTYTWYETLQSKTNNRKIILAPASVTYKQLLKNNTIGNLTAIYNAETLGKVYMPELRLRQDWGLWLTILKTGITGYCLPEILATYHTSGNSLSANKWKVAKYNWQILRNYQQLSLFASIWYFIHFLFFKTKKYFF
ncbi:MAG TPA: glycosyltransferase family 2 protein [Chitinophagales bacterium]|nr:glycosyltransferase family 2 protein [Chitinophagales bacterium]